MNRIQHIHFARRAGKTKHQFASKWEALTQPRVRLSLIALALWAFAGSNTNASDLASGTKDLNPSGVQVWLKKGEHKLNLDSKGVILKGYDPVAYFTQKKAVKGSPKYQTTYQGATYYFSSAADLATFKKNPSKYVPQYGGFCANGVKNNQLNDADPTVFFIIKGKLYVCESPAAEKEFRAHEDEDIITANRNWYQMFH